MTSAIINQNQVSAPMFVPAGGFVTVTPQAGASALVEYTTSSAAAVIGGIARWTAWPKGAASVATRDIANNPVYVRATALGGAVTLTVDETASPDALDVFRRDWRSANMGPIVLAQSGIASSITGTVAETTLASVTVPGGLMGPNGSLRVNLSFSMVIGAAQNKTMRVKLGGTTFLLYTLNNSTEFLANVIIRNRNSQGVQLIQNSSNAGIGASSTAMANAAIDTTVDQLLTITGQLQNAGDSVAIEGYTVEVLPSNTGA